MKKINKALLCILSIFLLSFVHLQAAAPYVVESVPADGDENVSPEITQIRIEFSEPMKKGFSLTGGGPSYPEVTVRPRWVNSKTLILSVKLEPNHSYRLGINSRRHKNFRSKLNTPCQPDSISFTTTSAVKKSNKKLSRSDIAKQSMEELKTALLESYSYRDKVTEADWDKQFKAYSKRLSKATFPSSFAAITADMLGIAEDLHIRVQTRKEGRMRGTHKRSITRNYNLKLLPRLLKGYKRPNRTVSYGSASENIKYLLISSWSSRKSDDFDCIYQFLEKMKVTDSLIIDVRPNSGGNEGLARKLAGCFIDEPKVYAQNISIVPGSNGVFSDIHKRVLRPNRSFTWNKGNIVVLTGQANMSSCESFILMMKQVPNCKIIGDTTYGSSGNPKPHTLSNGVTVYLPSWKAMDTDGVCLEGKGITPDIKLEFDKVTFLRRDPVFKHAVSYLKKHK